MIDIWEGTVICHRKALSHISHNQCLGVNKEDPRNCGPCGNHHYITALRAAEEQRVRERREECKRLASRRAS